MRFAKGNKVGHRFKLGESGNPGGRPRKKPITEAYERALTDRVADKIARGIIAAARRGNVKAASEIADRVEGKPSLELRSNLAGQVLLTNIPRPRR